MGICCVHSEELTCLVNVCDRGKQGVLSGDMRQQEQTHGDWTITSEWIAGKWSAEDTKPIN